MKKPNAIIVGGTGQFGITLSKQLLKKKFKVTITTRSLSRAKKKLNNKKLDLKKLNILSKTQIKKLVLKYNPKIIFYLAGQSSPGKSFYSKKETYFSNFIGFLSGISISPIAVFRLAEYLILILFINSISINGSTLKKISAYYLLINL